MKGKKKKKGEKMSEKLKNKEENDIFYDQKYGYFEIESWRRGERKKKKKTNQNQTQRKQIE